MPDEISSYIALQRKMHEALRLQHPEWRGRAKATRRGCASRLLAPTILANAGYFRSESFLTAHADNLTAFDLDDP